MPTVYTPWLVEGKRTDFAIIRTVDFDKRYNTLNERQREAVETIDGPLMVIAGPGTGKTELLSMRAAYILKKTDSTPQNILCLTFTEQGAEAMQRRLIDIIGPEGYQIAVHTFHGFAADIASRYRHYFYGGAEVSVADNIQLHQIISSIVESLEYNNPLKTSFGGEYTALGDIRTAISEIKRSGMTEDELQAVIEADDLAVSTSERYLREAFSTKLTKASIELLRQTALEIAAIDEPTPRPGIPKLSRMIATSLVEAIESASAHPRITPPLTAWRNEWCTKDAQGNLALKSRARLEKLRALLPVYRSYRKIMIEAKLQDFDDLILELIHVIETQAEVRFELQEQYQYLMVDEFQDTNLAQMRILDNLTNNPVNEGEPNLMVVGDDDQAIFSFQGANIGNVLTFLERYTNRNPIVLRDNYRSPDAVLKAARNVITAAADRLEAIHPHLSKELTAHQTPDSIATDLIDFHSVEEERSWIAERIHQQLTAGVPAAEIAVIAKKHADLEALLPYLSKHDIAVSYEKRENVLTNESVSQLILLSRVVNELSNGHFDAANIALPELLAHPAWGISTDTLWQLSLQAHHSRKLWFELLSEFDETKKFHEWLQENVKQAKSLPLELMLDRLMGHNQPDAETFVSPLKTYFFKNLTEAEDATKYLECLDSLYAIREKMRGHFAHDTSLSLEDFIRFVDLHYATGNKITRLRRYGDSEHAVNLLTAHGSKGLEFDTVYIVNATDGQWGMKARGKTPLISYPENLRLRERTNSPEERLRLFYVAMTRSKCRLFITYASRADNTKTQLLADFLASDKNLARHTVSHHEDTNINIEHAELKWYDRLVDLPPQTLQTALADRLRTYKLSATDFCNFLDVTKGGPRGFLLNNLLHFPSAMSPAASYGSAFHAVLQRAHNHILARNQPLPEEDILQLFEQELRRYPLSDVDFEHYLAKGSESLHQFLTAKYASFRPSQVTELNFASQQVVLGSARLKGKLDVVDIDKKNKTLTITDYKTGSAFSDWGKGGPYDKLKAHHYSQQLRFYELLVKHSRDYRAYAVTESLIQFVEPTKAGEIHALPLVSTEEDLERLSSLIQAVWKMIMNGEFPDTSSYSEDSKGILAFENDLLGIHP